MITFKCVCGDSFAEGQDFCFQCNRRIIWGQTPVGYWYKIAGQSLKYYQDRRKGYTL